MVTYRALFERASEDGTVTVTFPDFGWGVTQGRDAKHAMDMAQALLHDLAAHMMDRNEDLPAPRRHSGRSCKSVSLPPYESAKVELYLALKEAGIHKSELARRLSMPRANVNRLFDLNHSSRFDQLEAAFRALGKRVVLTVEDAA